MINNSLKIKKVLLAISFLAVLFLILENTGNLGNTIKYDRSGASVNNYVSEKNTLSISSSSPLDKSTTTTVEKIIKPVIHIKTPEPVRAFYMTNCVASGKNMREPIVEMIKRTEINSVVIDVKDYTGYLSIDFGNKKYPIGGKTCLVNDMREFLSELGEKNIYKIARIAVMQDPYYAENNPDQAVKRKDNGGVWKDKKGLAFVDPASIDFWKYTRDIAIDAYEIGFDEVNFDYVRYPTDGAISNMSFKLSASSTKRDMMKKFFTYMGKELKDKNIPSSVDIFGMTTTAKDDLGIGQMIEDALLSFDYVAPMVYPSHYPKMFNGWSDPNMVVGPLTEFVMGSSVERAKAIGLPASKLRTWVQDFDYGKVYGEKDIKAIISGAEKVGVYGYMVWDPSNRYVESAYQKRETAKAITSVESIN